MQENYTGHSQFVIEILVFKLYAENVKLFIVNGLFNCYISIKKRCNQVFREYL